MKRQRGVGKGDQAVDQTVDISMAHVLMLLSQGMACGPDGIVVDVRDKSSAPGRVFECKTCNRQFPSFQALGGHRASHKKPRLVDESHGTTPTKPRVHECSICGVEFALGQALGGHMRRHRTEGFVVHGSGKGEDEEEKVEKRKVIGTDGRGEKRVLETLDLNLTPTENDAELRLLTFSLGPPLVR